MVRSMVDSGNFTASIGHIPAAPPHFAVLERVYAPKLPLIIRSRTRLSPIRARKLTKLEVRSQEVWEEGCS